MYRRPKFLEVLLKIREEMAREADHDVDFFVEMIRDRMQPATDLRHNIAEPDGNSGKGKRAGGRSKNNRTSAK